MTAEPLADVLDVGAAWFAVVVPASIRVALIVLLTWGVASVLRSWGAPLRSLVWTAGLTLALMMPLAAPLLIAGPLSSAFAPLDSTDVNDSRPASAIGDGSVLERAAPPVRLDVPDAPPAPELLIRSDDGWTVDGSWAPDGGTFPGWARPVVELSVGGRSGWSLVAAALGLLSLGGSLLLGARLVAGQLGGWSRTRRLPAVEDGPWATSIAAMRATEGMPRRVRFVAAPGAVSPQTWGLFRPTVVLPSDGGEASSGRALTAPERRAVLRHELAHVERFDTLWLAAERLLVALFWWNSFVWPARRRAQLEREQACDDAVLGGGVTPSTYADQLLRQARGMRAAAGTGGVSMLERSDSQLRHRITSILDPGMRRGMPRRGVVAIALGGLLVAACSVSALGISEQTGPEEWASEDGVRIEEREHATLISFGEGEGALTATVPTGTRFASDTEIAAIEGGDTLEIKDTRTRPTRSIEMEADGAAIEVRYRLDGDERELDEAGREWLEATLLELFRRAGVDHEARVARIHADGGSDAVLAEVELLLAEFVVESYLSDLLALPRLEDGAARAVIEALPDLVRSDFMRARVIDGLDVDEVLTDPELRVTLSLTLRALNESPFELSRAIEGLLGGLADDEEAFASMLLAGADVRSDFERGRLLTMAAAYVTDEGPALDAWIDVAERIESPFERSRALERLLNRTAVSTALRLQAIELTAGIDADFSRSQLLVSVAEHFTRSDAEREAYRAAARSIRSDFERGRALAALDDFVSRR